MQKKLLVASGYSVGAQLFNTVINDFDVKASVRPNRTRCKRYQACNQIESFILPLT